MIVAEGPTYSARARAQIMLQWGRNLIVAEGCLTGRFNRYLRRFNGAAT